LRNLFAVPDSRKDPCTPSPCGPNSQCRSIEDHAVCSCLRGYLGSPPSCRPECLVSSECPPTRACVNKKCTDPCLGSCGLNARCEVINHSPICSCLSGQTGDPFRSCYDIPRKKNYLITNEIISMTLIEYVIHNFNDVQELYDNARFHQFLKL